LFERWFLGDQHDGSISTLKCVLQVIPGQSVVAGRS